MSEMKGLWEYHKPFFDTCQTHFQLVDFKICNDR